MWIMSKVGFYSIVKKDGQELYQVRARERRDLINLMHEAGLKLAIRESDMTDYTYRVLVDEDQLQEIMLTLGELVDYPNFKGEVDRHPDQRNKPYHEVWSVMVRALGAFRGGLLKPSLRSPAGDPKLETW